MPIGGRNGAWVAGDFIYVLTRNCRTVCLTRRGGRVRWIAQLPRFEDEEDQEAPIVVGSRTGRRQASGRQHPKEIWSYPRTPEILGRIEVSGPVLISPVVARETVYVLTDEADLAAYR